MSMASFLLSYVIQTTIGKLYYVQLRIFHMPL